MSEHGNRRVGGSRRPIHRIHLIHEAVKEGGYPNCRSLAERLEVTDKTIQRDVTFMRCDLGLPLEYDRRMHGYVYTGAVDEHTTIGMGAKELAGYLLAREAIGAVRGTGIEQVVREMFSQLNRMVEYQVNVPCDHVEQLISRRTRGLARTDPETFGRLAEALLGQLEASFHYHKIGAERTEPRRVQPYHLGEVDGCWYLIGMDLKRNALRTFALPRISRVHVETVSFVRPAEFDGAGYLDRSFSVWSVQEGETAQLVQVKLRGYAARMAQERRWHPTQELKRLDTAGELVELRFQVSRPEELLRWVLSWGSKAKVVGPECLKQRVSMELTRMRDEETLDWGD
ncbi:helix-turn-helix transcriptional regulator [Haloferula chungangensis]|uniref:Helix-turn-helix transcriptional regulator n=1 Tax=Haloferula chungangensis TaxID=1048331 RepID=A0ABW2L7S8_9BACT